MYIHRSKKDTWNNINNIEEIAVNHTTPEDIIIEAQEQNDTPDEARGRILNELEETGILTLLDIEVLMGWTSRAQAADKLNIKYEAYKKRLQRKIQDLRKIKGLYEKMSPAMQ